MALKKMILTFLIGALSLFMINGVAKADLGITPTIISFKDGDRYKDVTLVNTSETTKTFQMSWKFFEMQETGASYKPIDAHIGNFDVSKYVFFTPRRVTIPAKGSQKIRMAFRRPSDVPEGDFHAHLLFSPADNPVIDDGKEQEKSVAAGVSVKVGYSIPVVIRTGDFQEKASIGQISIARSTVGKLTVNVPITRQAGSHGIIGHMDVFHLGVDGKDQLVGEVANANIFPEIETRIIPVTLQEEINGGRLRIVLRSGTRHDQTVYDEEIFPLN